MEEAYASIKEFTKPYDKVIILADFNYVVSEGKEGREVGDFCLVKKDHNLIMIKCELRYEKAKHP